MGTINEAKATYCGRCGTTHVPPSKGGKCPALKESATKTLKQFREEAASLDEGREKLINIVTHPKETWQAVKTGAKAVGKAWDRYIAPTLAGASAAANPSSAATNALVAHAVPRLARSVVPPIASKVAKVVKPKVDWSKAVTNPASYKPSLLQRAIPADSKREKVANATGSILKRAVQGFAADEAMDAADRAQLGSGQPINNRDASDIGLYSAVAGRHPAVWGTTWAFRKLTAPETPQKK